MITLISPAKTLDYTVSIPDVKTTMPLFLPDSERLIKVLKKMKVADIQKLMDVSQDIAALNYARFKTWSVSNFEKEAKPAILVFKGDVYRGLAADSLSAKELAHAQNGLRILSGLYGVLRPLDLMLPYRLEMGTSLQVSAKAKNLYAFWDTKITNTLNEDANGAPIINLASNEYFKSVKTKLVKSEIITPIFKEFKNGKYSTVMTYAKLARGKMTRYIIKNNINNPSKLKLYNEDGYIFTENMSTDTEWVFTR
jgi:uncharacterized protein